MSLFVDLVGYNLVELRLALASSQWRCWGPGGEKSVLVQGLRGLAGYSHTNSRPRDFLFWDILDYMRDEPLWSAHGEISASGDVFRLPEILQGFEPDMVQDELALQSMLSHSSAEECRTDPSWLFGLSWLVAQGKEHQWVPPEKWGPCRANELKQIQSQFEGNGFDLVPDNGTTAALFPNNKRIPRFCKTICPRRLENHIRGLLEK